MFGRKLGLGVVCAMVAFVLAAPMAAATDSCGTSHAYIGSSSCTSGCEYIVFDAPGAILWTETNGWEEPQIESSDDLWCAGIGTDTPVFFAQ